MDSNGKGNKPWMDVTVDDKVAVFKARTIGFSYFFGSEKYERVRKKKEFACCT